MPNAVTIAPAVKPRLRGVVHKYAFFTSLALGPVLILTASDRLERLAAVVYACSVAGLFGASALYHRVNWRRPAARAWMRRIDHSMIFVLIAGTYTPFALLASGDGLGSAILAGVWTGAGAGVVLKLVWIDAPNWLSAGVYIVLGWVAVLAFPAMWDGLGVVPTLLVGTGGILYTIGAVVYATRRPDPVPAIFGYHEIFHVLVVAAAALQYAVVAFWVL